MKTRPWAVDKKQEAKVKQIYMQATGVGGHQAIFAVEFDRNVEVNAKEFGFILEQADLERLANFLNSIRAQQMIYIPPVQR